MIFVRLPYERVKTDFFPNLLKQQNLLHVVVRESGRFEPANIVFSMISELEFSNAINAEIESIKELFPAMFGHSEKVTAAIEQFYAMVDKHCSFSDKHRSYKDLSTDRFPCNMLSTDQVMSRLMPYYDFEHDIGNPKWQLNVLPCPTILSVAVDAMSARWNENSLADLVGPCAARAEVSAVAMLIDLLGYDQKEATGLFTFGGSGCLLYGCKVGIEKALPNARFTGITQTIHMYMSDRAHYSNKTAAMWCGIGVNNVKVIPSDDVGEMDVEALRLAMEQTLAEGALIGPIIATMGTTDAFSLDPIHRIAEVRNSFQQRVPYKIHIHADAVIGWAYSVFVQPDPNNILQEFPERIRGDIENIVGHIQHLNLADSIGIDFHKTGFTSYVCSCVLFKHKTDLLLLSRTQDDMPYISLSDEYHPGTYTLECSRPNYALKAVAQMLLFGREGYQLILSHMLQVSERLRYCLASPNPRGRCTMAVVNRLNPAFVTLFRVYPTMVFAVSETMDSPDQLLDVELHHPNVNPLFVQYVNSFNQAVGTVMKHHFSFTSSYRKNKCGHNIYAIKSYPMNPRVSLTDMDELVEKLHVAIASVEEEWTTRPIPTVFV